MEVASVELARVCTIGGEWNGRGNEGANTFWEEPYVSESLESFETFRDAVVACIKVFPYVHYDDDAEQIVHISDDNQLFEDDEDGNWKARSDLVVLKLEVPDDSILLEWYEDLKSWRDV